MLRSHSLCIFIRYACFSVAQTPIIWYFYASPSRRKFIWKPQSKWEHMSRYQKRPIHNIRNRIRFEFLCNSIRFRNSTTLDVFILENVNIPFLMGTNQLPCCVCECVCQRMSMLFIHICVEMLVTMCTIPNALPQDETYVYFFDVFATNENPNIFVWPEREIWKPVWRKNDSTFALRKKIQQLPS